MYMYIYEYRKSEKSRALPTTIPAFLHKDSNRYQLWGFASNLPVFICLGKTHGALTCPDLEWVFTR